MLVQRVLAITVFPIFENMVSPAITENVWTMLRNGDENALLTLYNHHYLGLINFGIKITGDRTLTHDCITQLLIELWDKRASLPLVNNVRCYLLTSLKHKILFELKAKQIKGYKLADIESFPHHQEISYEEHLIKLQTDEGLKQKLNKAFLKLTPRQKQLLQMKFFEDIDYNEIARSCNITRRTAYNIIHDSLKILKAELYKMEKDHAGISSAGFLPIVIMICLIH
ncbi:sigma-70 family RNA polymerase sigma factor [Hanamia caeni]|uniref:Sigma-70 family RNA polymerase sigma factor n=2 Tax=Hanamia caeni TaxID=2294116 RepID=A0A3M9NDC7_9BACT|nr:sigma-70 family RNA polymerase sigma factor [Hanamia caeni]